MGQGKSITPQGVELYLASTPLQILNAVEARHALGDENAMAVLILFQKRWEHRAAASTLPGLLTSVFDEVVTLGLEVPGSGDRPWYAVGALWRNRRSVLRVSAEFSSSPIRMVVVTNQWNRDMRYLAAEMEAEIVFADDGTSTASYLKAWAECGARADWRLGFANRSSPANLSAAALYRMIYGAFLSRSRPKIMFTRYRALAEEAGFPIVDNKYDWLRAVVGKRTMKIGAIAHFLGAPLVERKEVSESLYLKWLCEVFEHQPELTWIYVPHPAESDEWLERVGRKTGVVCQRMQAPYEFSVLMGERSPTVIASWFSSVLDNLEVFGLASKLWAFRIPTGCLANPTLSRSAEEFYKRHQGSGSSVCVHLMKSC